jgi:glycosyltransferase involved in cell wall biosynthesis
MENINKYQPFISVLIPTYNFAQYIGQAIDSILAQDYANLEIIVVDDGSTDNTQEIVATFVETLHATSLPNIRYFRKEHSGISATHNALLEKAQGELIAWCDADDYWLSGKLKTQIDYLEKNPECQIIFTKYEHFFENENTKDDLLKNPVVVHQINFAQKNHFYLPSSLAQREVFEICGNFNEEITTGEDDTEMVHRMQIFGIKSHYLENIFYQRRLHASNITWTHSTTSLEMIKQNMLINIKRNVQRKLKK